MVDISNRLRSDYYLNPVPYPSKPSMPDLLKKKAADLTPDEIALLPEAQAAYAKAMLDYPAQRRAYNEGEAQAIQRFRDDLEEHYGLKGHPRADALWSKAWEYGHSSGLSEVHIYYSDLVDLVA